MNTATGGRFPAREHPAAFAVCRRPPGAVSEDLLFQLAILSSIRGHECWLQRHGHEDTPASWAYLAILGIHRLASRPMLGHAEDIQLQIAILLSKSHRWTEVRGRLSRPVKCSG